MEFSLLVLLRPIMGAWSWARTWLGISREHDVANFRKLDAIANEGRLDYLLNSRIYNRSFSLDESHLLDDLILALQRIENRYLDRALQKHVESLVLELSKLRTSVLSTFFSTGGGRLKFRPEYIDQEVYDAEWKDIVERIEHSWKAYTEYRLAVKQRLKV